MLNHHVCGFMMSCTKTHFWLNDNIVFGSLLSNVEYEIRLLATYDLHDGLGEQVDEVIYSTLVDTLARKSPVGNAASISISVKTSLLAGRSQKLQTDLDSDFFDMFLPKNIIHLGRK